MSPELENRYRNTNIRGIPRKWIRRLYQVARIFARFNFGSFLHSIGMDRFLPKTRPNRRADVATAGLEWPVRVRLALQELGVVAVKIGQALSSRSDLLPLDLIVELRRLQDSVEPFPFAQAKQIVESELNAELSELFAEFSEEPAASASIGQVYRAVLPDGQAVAVKVQRPGLGETVETELQMVEWAAAGAERYSRWCAEVQTGELAVEFAQVIRDELNYRIEAHNTEHLRKNLDEEPGAVVPKVYWALSTRRVLTTQWVDGHKPENPEMLVSLGINPRRAAANLSRLVLRQIFVHGYFHGDPHPGNVLVQSGERIVFLDCGNAMAVGPEMQDGLVRLLMATMQQDTVEILDQLLSIGMATEATNMQRLRIDVDRLTSRYAGLAAGDVSVGEIIDNLMAVISRHRIRMPAVFAGLMKALIVTEGVCLTLDPGYDFRESATAVAREALASRVNVKHLMGEVGRFGRDLSRFMTILPRQINQVLTRAQGPGLRVRIHNEDLDRHIRRVDVAFSRLSVGLVAAAIIVGSAVMLSSQQAVGGIGYTVSAVYGVVGAMLGGWLVYSIWRSGRL